MTSERLRVLRIFLGKNKRRYGRGAEYAGLVLLLSANAKLFQSTFEGWGIGLVGGFIALGCLYLWGCWFLGYIDETWGIWKEDNEHGWVVVPSAFQMSQSVEEIKKMLQERK